MPTYTYTTLDDPLGTNVTLANGINATGHIVGTYADSGSEHGFLYSGGSSGTYITIDDPLATHGTLATGINATGQIVGYYADSSFHLHGFLYNDGNYTTIDDSLASPPGTQAYGINATGQIVGDYGDSSGVHGFLASPRTAPPVMLDALSNAANDMTTLNGTAEANSRVSVFDGSKLIGAVTAGSDGTWSLQANVTGNVVHSFTETSTDLAGSSVSSAGVTLYTPAAHKVLTGGNGNDVLIGRPNDTLTGGAGADTLVFNSNFGKETVTDYNVSQDVLALSHTLFTNDTASQVLSQTHDSKAGAVIVADAGDTVISRA
jgi:probable HAF family extracellular repeat protein